MNMFRVTRILRADTGMMATASSAASSVKKGVKQGMKSEGKENTVLKKGAKRDPELYVLLGIMSGAFALAGFYFGRKPTSATSEAEVSVANSSMPWEVEGDHDHNDHDKHFKYQYHPRGDKNSTPRNAPSALNTVVVPNVTLPRELHDMFNKWGKDGY